MYGRPKLTFVSFYFCFFCTFPLVSASPGEILTSWSVYMYLPLTTVVSSAPKYPNGIMILDNIFYFYNMCTFDKEEISSINGTLLI